jgi:YD repeat-containing protein
MVAIITGEGVGLERSSAWVLGSRGQLGSAPMGRDSEGVYVNAATGNLVISRQDEFLIGKGPDIAISRTYNSRAVLSDGDNNDQWQTGVYRKVIGTNGNATITRIDWDGSDRVYELVSANLYRTKDGAGAYDTLAWSGTQWTWTDGNSRITDVYDSTGKLLSTNDTDGNSLAYTYDPTSGLLTRVTNGNGADPDEYTDLGYYAGTSRLEKLTTQADSQLTRVFYEYDTDGRLSVVKVNIDPADNSKTTGANYTTTYTYEGTSKRVASIAQLDGSLLEFVHTLMGSEYRVTKLTQTVVTGVTRVTGFFYDTANRVTTITDALGGVTTMTYDVKGNLTQLVLPVPIPGASAPTTSFVYNPNGDVDSMTENGRTTVYTYDSNGNMTLSRDSAGNTVRRLYGAKNELLTDTRYLAPDPDGGGAQAAGTPLTARYAYDIENHLRFAVNADGEVTEYRYNAPGQLTGTIAYPANFYAVGGLAWDVVLDETTLANWVNGIADKSGVRRTDTTYDARGNVRTVTSFSAANSAGDGLLTSDYSRDTYIYDQAGQLIDRYNNASAALEHFVYDGLGRLVASTDMAGTSTTFAYNDAASTTTVTLSNVLTRATVYNRAGERISVSESGSDITTAVTTEHYDGLGRLRRTIDATGRSTYFLYDNASRKVADITADGAVTEYGYDSSHRLVKTIAYVNKLDSSQIASLAVFDAGGNGGANAGGGGTGGPGGPTLLTNGSFDTLGTGGSGLSHPNLLGWFKNNGQNFEQVAAGSAGVTGTDGAYWLDLESVPGSGAYTPVGSNLVLNPSFETSAAGFTNQSWGRSSSTLPNWTKTNAEDFEQVLSSFYGVTATNGSYWLDLDSVQTGYAAVGSNLLTNGSFETSGSGYTTISTGRTANNMPSWTNANSYLFEQVTSGQMGVTATDGSFWFDMDSVAGANPNLIVNGSFEQSAASYTTTGTGRLNDASMNIPGWVKTNALGYEQVNSGVNGTNATDGAFYLDMDSTGAAGSNMDISQTVSGLTAGQAYTLKFDYANNAGFVGDEWDSSGSLDVLWNGNVIATIGVQNIAMATKTYTVTATGTTGVLRFRETGIRDGIGALIDNVRLNSNASTNGGNMDISQTVSGLPSGSIMQIQFDHANRTTSGSGSFQLLWNGGVYATINSTGTTMQTKTYYVITQAGTNTLRFRGTGTVDTNGASLDNVRLFATQPTGGGNMDISQTIAGLTGGAVMQLQFDHANRTTAASGSFEVYWNNALAATITDTGTTMQTKTYNVTAIAGNNSLRFKSIGTVDTAGASIDNVRLFATQVDPGGGNMDVYQTVPNLTANQSLQLQFNYANRTSATSGGFEVWWNAQKLDTITTPTTAMTFKSYDVTALAGNNTIRFISLGTVDAVGASLDNVRLFAIQGAPTPPTPAPTTDALQGMRPVADPAKDAWTWRIYDSADRLIETIDATGAATIFAYDGASQLLSSKSYAEAIAPATIAGFKTTTPTALVTPATNSLTDQLTRNFYDNAGRVVATLDGAGGLTRFEYDEAGFQVRELGAAKAAASGLWAGGTLAELVTSVGTNAADRRTDLVYDGRGLLRFTIDATAKPVEYVYDVAGRIIRTVDYAGSITAAASYSLAYMTAQTGGALGANAANRISRTVYDAAGRAAFTIDASGAVTGLGYDALSRLVKQTAYANPYTVAGDQALTTMQGWATGEANNGNNRISRIVYDAAGRIAYQVDAETYVTEHQYDTAGRITKDIRYAGQYPSIVDGVSKTSLAALIGPPPGTEASTTYGYDAAGRLTDVTDGIGATTHYVLDGLGQATDTIVAYNSAYASTTRRVFNAAGQVTSETRGFNTTEAATTLFDYDRVGNLLTVTDARNNPIKRDYDSLGRVVKVTVQVDSVVGNNLVTTNEYDAFGNVVRINDARLNNSFVYYDSMGRAWLQVDAEGYATKTTFNAFGEAANVTRYYSRPTGTPTVAVPPTLVTHAKDALTAFGYDRNGRVTSVTDAELKDESYQFNTFGDRTKVRNKLGSGLVSTDPAYNNFAVTYAFDKLGRVVSETLPVNAQRSDGTNATAIINKFEYDSRGNLAKTTEAFGIFPDQRITNYFYDKAGRVFQVTHDQIQVYATDLTPSYLIPTENFTYNARGELIQKVDAALGKTLCYYDALGRKTHEVSAVGTLTKWSYDGNGNLVGMRVYSDPVAIPANPGPTPPNPPANYRETLYDYDRANRLIKTTIASTLLTGAYAGGAYATASGPVYSSIDYLNFGGFVRDTDALGNARWTWLDKLGREVARMDAEKYVTTFTRDGEGNVLGETRLATRFVGTPDYAMLPNLTALTGTSAADRTTNFTYDRNGRRLTETRVGVAIATVSGTGSLTESTQDATIYYSYNALGEVESKTEANGDVTNFGYDNVGRLIWIKDPAMLDNGGASVRQMTETFYNGLSDVVRVEVNKEGGAVAEDRVTRFDYGAGGRLFSRTDATNFVRSFGYDAAGRVVVESYTRYKSDLVATVQEATTHRYDLAGREISRAMATWNGSAWQFGAASRIRYNPFGEVTGRGLTGGPNDAAVYQEVIDYDAAGRVWRTTTGDGTIKILFYDKAGNVTLSLSSAGADLSTYTQASAATAITAAGGTSIANAVTTVAVYDKRSLQTMQLEPDRQLSHNGSAFVTQAIAINRTFNAFGELLSESDARNAGWLTEYSYNNMGRLTQKISPSVAWTAENGALGNARPIETKYYDVSGRLVGVRDANNNRVTRHLLAGTGHGGEEALTIAEFHPDTGVARTFYDAFREVRLLRNELLNSASTAYNAVSDEQRSYDKMGRLTQITQRGGLLVDSYGYDGLGQRTRHWNSLLGAGNVERTDYDALGRVTGAVAFGGDTTTTGYAWNTAISTAGLGDFDGWTKTTTLTNGLYSTEHADYFGRLTARTDFGGHGTSFAYDNAGRLTSQAIAGETLNFGFFNTGLAWSVNNNAGNMALFGYDAAGNKTSEWTQRAYAVVQSATASYDALGRMTSWAEAGNATAPAATLAHEYDLASNIRRSLSTYRRLDLNGAPSTLSGRDNWYRYDTMNRVVTEDGFLSGVDGQGQTVYGDQARGFGTIKRQVPGPLPSLNVERPGGADYAYDAAGRRASMAITTVRFEGGSFAPTAYFREQKEMYDYGVDGHLSATRFATGTETIGTTSTPPPASGTGVLQSSFTRDAMGRVTRQTDWLTYNGTIGYERYDIAYNAKGQVTDESVASRRVNDLYTSVIDHEFGAGAGYMLGAATQSVSANSKNGILEATATTTNGYAWWDGAVQSTTTIFTDYVSQADTNYTTTYTLGASGELVSAYIADGRPRSVTLVTDMTGQVIRRDEADSNFNATTGGDPHEVWYRFAGRQVGLTGNNGTLDTDYSTSIGARGVSIGNGAFRFGVSTPTVQTDFSQALDPINSFAQGSAGGGYTVQAGDTLQSIAANLWGEAGLWYKLAEANGLSGGSGLVEGRNLVIPMGVMSNGHSADIFQPYEAGKVLGDLSPTAVKAPKRPSNKCGMMGTILLIAIAVAVTVVTSGAFAAVAASAASGTTFGLGAGITMAFGGAATVGGVTASLTTVGMMAAGAIGAAAGSIVSQGVGVATGIQSSFNWKGVALSALSGGIGGGIGPITGLQGASGVGGILQSAARGALASAATQGIAVATGLQDKFSWTSVAVAGVTSGAQALASRILPGSHHYRLDLGDGDSIHLQLPPSMGNAVLSGAAASLAGAAARSLLTGTDFGDNVLAELPDVVGSTVGLLVSRALTTPHTPADDERAGRPAQAGRPELGAQGEGLVPAESMDPRTDYASRMGRLMFRDRYIDDNLTPAQRIRELGTWVRQREYSRIIGKYFRFYDDTASSYQGLSFADSRAILTSHLSRLLQTRTGLRQVMRLAADGHIVRFHVDNRYYENASPAFADFERKTVTINVAMTRNGFRLHTTAGYRQTPLFIILGHELGHAIYNYRDVAPRDMLRDPIGDNVRYVENPLRAEVGEPLRDYYSLPTYNAVRIIEENRRRRAGN